MMESSPNGKFIHYVTRGEGWPVILVHGIASSLHSWHYLIPTLASAGFRGYALDLPGHGESAGPAESSDLHIGDLSRQFADWVVSLKLDRPPWIVGHSLGAYLALCHTVQQPQGVRGLILVDPYYSPTQLSPFLKLGLYGPQLGSLLLRLAPIPVIQAALSLAFTTAGPLPHPLRRQVALDFKRADPAILGLASTAADLTPELPGIAQPTLVVWGARDLTLSPASFPRLVRLLPNARGQAFSAAGHTPHLTHAVAFNHLTLGFLARA